MSSKDSIFKNVPLFSGLSAKELMLIKARCSEVSFPKGSVIFQQGDLVGDFYIVVSGNVEVVVANRDGREIFLSRLTKGEFFGELSLLDGKPRSATIVAEDDVRCLCLKRGVFLKIMDKNPRIATVFLSVMAKRLRLADDKIKTLSFLDVIGRVAKVLLEMVAAKGIEAADNYVKIPYLTHQALANHAGTSREAVSKAMKSLVSNGLIEVKGKEIVLSAKALEYCKNYLDN